MLVQVGLYEGSTFFDNVIKVYCWVFRKGDYRKSHSCIVKGTQKVESLPGKGMRKAHINSYPGKWILSIYNVKDMTQAQSDAIWNDAQAMVKDNKGYDFSYAHNHSCGS